MDLLTIPFTQEVISYMIFFTIFGCAVIAEIANNKRIDQICLVLFLIFIIYPSVPFFQPFTTYIIYLYDKNPLFSHSWFPFLYQYSFGLLIFGGGLFAIFKAYGDELLWGEYKAFIVALVWGFIYVTSIHLIMTIAALNNAPQLYFIIFAGYLITALLLSRYIR